jgi:2-polyprenyl-6-methoxyphenol hydroxylase-like FAD-dependent oxidoreductase
MINEGTHTEILIVGAGPSGLMMAAQLLRYGIQPLIIDAKSGPTTKSNALAVQARSLEIYRQMGIVDKFITDGKQARGVVFNDDAKEVASLTLTNIGEGQTPFPFVDLYQQSKNEKALLDYLTQNTCPVFWETTLTSFKQGEARTEVQLIQKNNPVNIRCTWLIGTDGAHSTVRKQLNIPFNGDTYQHEFYLADIALSNVQLHDDFLHLFLTKKNITAFFPLPEKNRFRVIGNLPDDLVKKEGLLLDDVIPTINTTTGFPIGVIENHWFTTYRLHHRMAANFRQQRCFLIGDAAHIHSPVGGQGMNTGLQDAYNLAWKLAGVVNKQLSVKTLNSYAEERMPVAKRLLNFTDRAFTLIMSRNWVTTFFKKWILPRLLKYVWSKESLREVFFTQVSQIGINYRNSLINLHISQATKIKAGDRLPYIKLYDEKKEEETDLHEWCAKPGFTLIIFGKFDELFLFNVARWITMKYPNRLNFYYLPPSGKNVAVFNAFETNPHMQKAIIVRPDMHIGLISDTVDLNLMDNYLRNVVGFI